MLYRRSLIFITFIIMLLIFLTGMKQYTMAQQREHSLRAKALQRTEKLILYMKQNPLAASAGAYDSEHSYQIPICAPCSQKEQARIDLMNWNLKNKLALPQGHGKVAFDKDSYKITVQWRSKQHNPHCQKEFNCVNVLFDLE